MSPAGGPKIVGFLCDYAVSAQGMVQSDGTMRELPNVTLIQVPCSGFIRPSWLEFALRNGADGTFVCGCPLGDCFNRLGNNLMGDRITQMRRRMERQRIHPDRVAMLYYGLHDRAEFVAAVRAFSDHVATLPGPVVPPARAAAPARPAPTAPAATPAQTAASGDTRGAAAPTAPGGVPPAAGTGPTEGR